MGGSIFWKTREIGLPSYSKICTLCTTLYLMSFFFVYNRHGGTLHCRLCIVTERLVSVCGRAATTCSVTTYAKTTAHCSPGSSMVAGKKLTYTGRGEGRVDPMRRQQTNVWSSTVVPFATLSSTQEYSI
jgi:hypothetical protein